jgi:[citrate (pro-3S)-lyase] ligase
MCSSRYISEQSLSVASVRARVEGFLSANGLRLDPVDRYVTVTRDEDSDEILAGGGLAGDVIKCVAVSEAARGEGLMNALVSRLVSIATEEGHTCVKAFTKPENVGIFKDLGFSLLARAGKAVLMECGCGGISEYSRYLSSLARPGGNGAIVMNANPFTKGHRYLVEQAAAQVDNLYVIPVREERSRFPYAERKAMIEAGCAGLGNVTVCEGSGYAISAATFPTYFLKRLDDAAPTQMELDLDLFARHIAAPLGVCVRFVGSEPLDALTREYNGMMASVFASAASDASVAPVTPDNQVGRPVIEVVEIPRLEQDGKPLNATDVRRALDEGRLQDACGHIPETSIPYLVADLAESSLRTELDTTPKPGLVDKADNGAHKDMDYRIMSAGISALRPWFVRIAVESAHHPDSERVRLAGIEAEKAMLAATGGVNTHKGALFCIGLSVAAASFLATTEGRVTESAFREGVARLAAGIPSSDGTHGAAVRMAHKVAGALDNAREAWPRLFGSWLPFYRSLEGDPFRRHKTLLRIITELDDSNILHRRGAVGLELARSAAGRLLEDFSEAGLASLNKDFIRENISPGGSADMLALTMFVNNILTTN